MKTIISILSIIFITSCATKKAPPNISFKWKGRNTLVIVIDSTGKDTYKPVYIKVILKKERNSKKNKNQNSQL